MFGGEKARPEKMEKEKREKRKRERKNTREPMKMNGRREIRREKRTAVQHIMGKSFLRC